MAILSHSVAPSHRNHRWALQPPWPWASGKREGACMGLGELGETARQPETGRQPSVSPETLMVPRAAEN